MSVVVEEPEPRVTEQLLLPPGRAPKRRNGPGDVGRLEAELMQQRDDRRGIGDIFLAEQPDCEIAQLAAVAPELEPRANLTRRHRHNRADSVLGKWIKPIRD